MKLPIFQVDAFTDKAFGGNPAAVCPLEQWLPDEVMQSIALENAVAETAFFRSIGSGVLKSAGSPPKLRSTCVAMPP